MVAIDDGGIVEKLGFMILVSFILSFAKIIFGVRVCGSDSWKTPFFCSSVSVTATVVHLRGW